MRRFRTRSTARHHFTATQIALYIASAATVAGAWYISPQTAAGLIAQRWPQTGTAPLPEPQPSFAVAQRPLALPVEAVPFERREPPVLAARLEPAAEQPPAPEAEDPVARIKVVAVEKGDTLMDILLESGVARADAVDAVDALGEVFRAKDLRPGQEITLSFESEIIRAVDYVGPQLASLSLQPSVERDVVVNRDAGGDFTAEAIDRPLKRELAAAAAAIDSSLFEAGQDSAVPLEVMSQMVKAFSYDVDFEREIQPGDRFELVYERFEDDRGRLARTGGLLYAALVTDGVQKELYRFEPKDGSADYYNAKGESVRKELLRTPLDVVRITSKFGMRRHPVLGYSKMHKGIDFAAATGTPIFAAGDGVVAKLGKQRGYGNYVQIKHNSQYATAYAHMSRYAKGLKQGDKVRQGEVIGYVGATGMATGPHLHYEILVAGKQINPMNVKLTGRKLEGKDLRRFEALKAEIRKLRQRLKEPVLVARNQLR